MQFTKVRLSTTDVQREIQKIRKILADLLILAIKPQDLPVIFQELGELLRPEQAVLSIIAGAKMSTLSKGFSHESIIRVMPNTPAQIGQGMSMWTCSRQVSEQQRDFTRSIVSTVGKEIYVDDEKYMDMATEIGRASCRERV